MNHLYFLKDRNPLQTIHTVQGINHGPHKAGATYTDQRIEEIKKKYDTPNKKSNETIYKQNLLYQKSQKQSSKALSLTQTKQKQTRNSFFDHSANYNSIDRYSKEKDKSNYPQISKFGIGQVQKGNQISTLQNFFIKPAINTKLKASQTDQNFFKPLNRVENDISNGIRCKDSYSKLNRREFQDPRIENIDKINSKIKRILDCIDHCEKEQASQIAQKRSKVEEVKNISSSILGRSIISNNDTKHQSNQLQQTKIIQKKQFYQESASLYQRSPIRDEFADVIPSLTQMRSSHSNNQFSQYLTSYKNRLRDHEHADLRRSEAQFQKPAPRSTSCADKVRSSNYQIKTQVPNDESKMDQINNQISKFQQKIAQLQEQKRKLNIRFKPFYYEGSPIKKLNASYQAQTSVNYISPLQKLKNDLEIKHKLTTITANDHQRIFSKAIVNQCMNQEEESIMEMQKQKCYDNFELRRKIGERMEQRKKKIQMFHCESKVDKPGKQTPTLINALCEQVKLDEQLRNSKNWLSECNSQQKVNILQNILRSRGVSLSIEEINEEFNTIKEDQSDPFFSFREEKYTIESVADNYLKSINHWSQNICHQSNKQQLFTQQNFAANFFNKNQILIEDFVRLLNTQSGNFYRNRDVYLIYQRIKKELKKEEDQKLSIQDLSQIFS